MRSAESSGAGAEGFGVSEGHRPAVISALRGIADAVGRFAGRLSPVGLAIAATTFAAAGLIVAVDAARTSIEVATQHRQLMSVAAAEPAARWAYTGTEMTTLAGPPATHPAFTDALHRALGTFAIALGVSAFALRRRRPGFTTPDRAGGYHDLLATMPFGAACWTARGELIACNLKYRLIVGMDATELRPGASYALSIRQLSHGGHLKVMSEDDANRLIELQREDGAWLVIDERPLAGGGFVTLVTDVTESRRTDDLLNTIREEQRQLARRYHEEKLRAESASRAKTTFLAHLSHDIRTPLNHIIGFADVMRQETYGPLGDRRYADYVADMKDSGERLLKFFASILELVELENGQKPLRTDPFAIDEMLVAVTRRFAPEAQRAGVTLALGAATGVRLIGDRFALERMAGNIVENAIRFTPPGGRVNVAAYAAVDGVVLEITDTGTGIAPERIEALSQPFAFGDSALTRQHAGAGLGIAIARAIAELSGGRLAIDSRPALGTTVAISLPLPAANAARVA